MQELVVSNVLVYHSGYCVNTSARLVPVRRPQSCRAQNCW